MNTQPENENDVSATPSVSRFGVVETADFQEPEVAPQWKSLTRLQRRVAGVLVEKAKTTPSAYPMTINAICNACNQKSNRSPVMDITSDVVHNVLDELRGLGAVTEVHGDSRVAKFRHHLSEWMGVDAMELAVMTELLLRGEQTIGDLRGRSSRMKKIDSVAELRPVVAALVSKNLIVELTPPGRGQMVTHNLYQQDELEQLCNEFGTRPTLSSAGSTPERREQASAPVAQIPTGSTQSDIPETSLNADRISGLENEVAELKQMVRSLENRIDELTG